MCALDVNLYNSNHMSIGFQMGGSAREFSRGGILTRLMMITIVSFTRETEGIRGTIHAA